MTSNKQIKYDYSTHFGRDSHISYNFLETGNVINKLIAALEDMTILNKIYLIEIGSFWWIGHEIFLYKLLKFKKCVLVLYWNTLKPSQWIVA